MKTPTKYMVSIIKDQPNKMIEVCLEEDIKPLITFRNLCLSDLHKIMEIAFKSGYGVATKIEG